MKPRSAGISQSVGQVRVVNRPLMISSRPNETSDGSIDAVPAVWTSEQDRLEREVSCPSRCIAPASFAGDHELLAFLESKIHGNN